MSVQKYDEDSWGGGGGGGYLLSRHHRNFIIVETNSTMDSLLAAILINTYTLLKQHGSEKKFYKDGHKNFL